MIFTEVETAAAVLELGPAKTWLSACGLSIIVADEGVRRHVSFARYRGRVSNDDIIEAASALPEVPDDVLDWDEDVVNQTFSRNFYSRTP
jgi:hypothetical protein